MFIRLLILCLGLLAMASPLHAAIEVSIDRDPVVLDESFQLVFKSDKQLSAQPDFRPLEKDFSLLNTSQRSSTQIINGRVSYSQQWVLTLLPKKTGQLQIPAIRFGSETSAARTINVISNTSAGKQQQTDDVFIEVSVDSAQPYVQAQVIYTVKLYRAIATSNATLSEPSLNGGQAIIDKIGDDKSYEAQRGGQRYVVIERRYVIFPQNSGEMSIEPVVFQGQTGPNGFFRFDPFGPPAKTVVKRSKPVQLEVKPIPANYPGKTWLPASNLVLQEKWSLPPDRLQQGEATTRTLILRADGLAASHLPSIDDELPAEFKHYPDQPEFEETNNNNGFTGTRLEKMAVMPTADGNFMLPAIRIHWWNTDKDRLETAELPEREVSVLPSAVAPVPDKPAPKSVQPDPEATVPTPETTTVEVTRAGFWPWLSAALLVLLLLTLVAWYRARTGAPARTRQTDDSSSSVRQLYNKVLTAARRDDAEATRKALLQWANGRWPTHRISSLGQLKPLVDESLQQELDRLNDYLYGRKQLVWKGKALADCIQSQRWQDDQSVGEDGRLEPLYKA